MSFNKYGIFWRIWFILIDLTQGEGTMIVKNGLFLAGPKAIFLRNQNKNIPFLKYAPRESAKTPTSSPFIVNSYIKEDLAIYKFFSVHNLSESHSHPYNLHL